MTIYLRLGHIFAFYIEWNKAYGRIPLIAISDCNGEMIIDIPFCQIIFTPGHKLTTNEKISKKNKKKEKLSGHKRENHSFSGSFKGASEN